MAWVAGLFEGEGSIGIRLPSVRAKTMRVTLQLVSVDRDVLVKLQSIAGGKLYGPYGPYSTQRQPYYMWSVVNKEAQRWLHLMLPYLGDRRSKRAQEALAITV